MVTADSAVTGTAAWIAAARARESARADRLFDDPWAHALAGSAGYARLAASERAGGRENGFLPVRTRFFDDLLLDAAGWAQQIVLLGAGLDTRAFRLGLPSSVTVYEIDRPGPLAAKDAVLAAAGARPSCARVAIDADLRGEWSAALVAAGFDRAGPTVWLAEGLMFYLDPPSVRALLSGAAALSETRAVLAADIFGTGLLRLPGMTTSIEQLRQTGRPLPFCTDEPAALLARHGWPRCTLTEPGQAGANFGRLPSRPDDWNGGADPTMRTYLAVAERDSPAARR